MLPAVPPLWLQLLGTETFRTAPVPSLRVLTNTGGRLPTDAVRKLRRAQPQAALVLMYGLTEAFRSTYLPPELADRKPNSIGQAIPGAELLVLRDDLTACAPGEHGQLVHRGPTVALGYWNDPEATARVFRPNPLRPPGTPDAERVVFSGDLVYRDEDGDLFFVGREDQLDQDARLPGVARRGRRGPVRLGRGRGGGGDLGARRASAERGSWRTWSSARTATSTASGSSRPRSCPATCSRAGSRCVAALPRTPSGKHDPASTRRDAAVDPA